MLQGCPGLVFGGTVAWELAKEAAGKAGGDPGEIEVLLLAPGENSPHRTRIGAAGMGIGDPGGEELIGSEQGIAAGTLEDGRDRTVRIQGLGSGHLSVINPHPYGTSSTFGP